LKGYDIEIEELDSIVHKLHHQVMAKIDCTKCANCCKQIKPILSQNDINELSKGIGLPAQQLKIQFLKKNKDGDYIFNKSSCPFLKDNLCTQYNYRPKECRSFPHLHKKEFVFRLIQVIENYSICPIAFNVYELLKIQLFDDYNKFIDDFTIFRKPNQQFERNTQGIAAHLASSLIKPLMLAHPYNKLSGLPM